MKKVIISLFVALMATVCAQAQQISVVSSTGSTSLYRTLQAAIEGAEAGSVVYLPGGAFSISNDYSIQKKLTIIGIGHILKNDNVDGCTIINGHLHFGQGSSGSALYGCYLSGDGSVFVGSGTCAVNDFLLRYCNVWDVNISSNSLGTVINQNYIRSKIYFNGTSGTVSNNIMGVIGGMNGGTVCNNVFPRRTWDTTLDVSNATISDNVFVSWNRHSGSDILAYHNLFFGVEWGDCLNLENVDPSDVFEKDDGVTSTSNYHFKEAYRQYENQYGIYAGDGFNDAQIAPVPYIVAKRIDEQTDASGRLNVKIRVKAGGE